MFIEHGLESAILTIAYSPQFKRLAAFQGDLVFQAPRRFFMQAMSRTQKTYAFCEFFLITSNDPYSDLGICSIQAWESNANCWRIPQL